MERILNQAVTEDLLICILHELRVLATAHSTPSELAERKRLGKICDADRDRRNSVKVALEEYLAALIEDDNPRPLP